MSEIHLRCPFPHPPTAKPDRDAEITHLDNEIYVRCPGCDAMGPVAVTEEEAVRCWVGVSGVSEATLEDFFPSGAVDSDGVLWGCSLGDATQILLEAGYAWFKEVWLTCETRGYRVHESRQPDSWPGYRGVGLELGDGHE